MSVCERRCETLNHRSEAAGARTQDLRIKSQRGENCNLGPSNNLEISPHLQGVSWECAAGTGCRDSSLDGSEGIESLRWVNLAWPQLQPHLRAAIDTTTASGELIFNIFSALAQFERRLIQERTKAGLAAARARGRSGGRPKLMVGDAKVVLAKKLHADKSLEIDDICKTLRISRSTFYRYVRL